MCMYIFQYGIYINFFMLSVQFPYVSCLVFLPTLSLGHSLYFFQLIYSEQFHMLGQRPIPYLLPQKPIRWPRGLTPTKNIPEEESVSMEILHTMQNQYSPPLVSGKEGEAVHNTWSFQLTCWNVLLLQRGRLCHASLIKTIIGGEWKREGRGEHRPAWSKRAP